MLVQDKREKQDKLAESNLYIKNLDDSQTDDKLRQLFEVKHASSSWVLVIHDLLQARSSLQSGHVSVPLFSMLTDAIPSLHVAF